MEFKSRNIYGWVGTKIKLLHAVIELESRTNWVCYFEAQSTVKSETFNAFPMYDEIIVSPSFHNKKLCDCLSTLIC